MIKTLRISNVAIIDDIVVNFENGLNSLTGETGAGKSIIFDALSFLLGDRADKSLIRYGQEKAKVSGLFAVDKNNEQIDLFAKKYDIEIDDEVLISRTITLDGKNEIKINGEPVTLSGLKELTIHLVDIYGQNDHQLLLKQKYHLKLLDNFSVNIKNFMNSYSKLFSELKSVNKKIESLGGSDEERLREMDYLEYQINEIEKANFSEVEEQELIEEKKKMSNLEKIINQTSSAQDLLDQLVLPNMSSAYSCLSSAAVFDTELEELNQRAESLKIELVTLFEDISEYNNNTYYDEHRFNEIDERLDLYKTFERKYGGSVGEILEKLNKFKDRYNLLNNLSEERELLFKQKKELLNSLYKVAKSLTTERKKVASCLESQIQSELADLGMKNAKIKFEFNDFVEDEKNIGSNGLDDVELYFSANLGEPLKPLNKIISGGEMSRLMLAIKTVVANTDDMPTMIFDEIESGISGNMAQAVAKKMARISKNHQVIVITHSAHIASMSDNHYLIEKKENNGKTHSLITKLDHNRRVEEIARFIATDSTIELSIANAEALLLAQKQFKDNL